MRKRDMGPFWLHHGPMKHVNLRLPDDLHEQAKTAAEADDRSLNSWLVSLVRRAVADGEHRSTQRT
ncbi:YlcI/YnfO family protein [Streptomyces sp. NPDC002935]|uniref:YlcI/YnfO family protein n=1 Tax=Streptomyces sp. NPDC002935 TaxID=3154545 RepID=UPI0033A65228